MIQRKRGSRSFSSIKARSWGDILGYEQCPECGSKDISEPTTRSTPAECLDCDWIEDRSKAVEQVLEKIDDKTAVRIKDSELPDKYLVEVKGVVVRICQYTETEEWLLSLYSNLVSDVQERWVDQALHDEWSSHTGLELIPREEVPDVDDITCIARYCQGDGLFTCRECGGKFDGGMSFARHAWEDHGITSDPREFRDPARGQMSLGERWSA